MPCRKVHSQSGGVASCQTDSDCWLRRGQRSLITDKEKKEIILISAEGVWHFRVALRQQLKRVSTKAWGGLKARSSHGAMGDCIYYAQCLMSLSQVRGKGCVFSVSWGVSWSTSEVKKVRGKRWHKRENPKQGKKKWADVGAEGWGLLWYTATFGIHDEKTERENRRVKEKNPHTYKRGRGKNYTHRHTRTLCQCSNYC